MSAQTKTGEVEQKNPTRLRVRLAALAVYGVLLCLVVELVARGLLTYHENVLSVSASMLDDYEDADPRQPGAWRLKSGYQSTLAQAIDAKQRDGKILGVSYLKSRAERFGVSPDDVILRINDAGFVGPELDPSPSRSRVLCLGDSCTFGTLFNERCYARVMERELQNLGRPIEVVNGGVEGYSPRHVLQRIDEFKALKPDVTTIYLGWNALYADRGLAVIIGGSHYRSATLTLLSKAWGKLGSRGTSRQQEALDLYAKGKQLDRNPACFAALDTYEFPSMLADLERIIEEMQSAGSRVVVLTLPSLLVLDEEPTDKAIAAGHLPHYTNNPWVVAKMVDVYNRRLRELAAKHDLPVIDLERWSKSSIQPRDEFFFDTCHLFEEGQQLLGQQIARELAVRGLLQETPNAMIASTTSIPPSPRRPPAGENWSNGAAARARR